MISGREVRELLPYPDCVNVIEGAMKAVSAGKAVMPLRQFMALPVGEGKLAWMPGYLGEPPCFGIKLLSLYPGNPAVGLSSHVGLYALYESSHGRPLVIMEASALTAVRTAAASVVATKALARGDSKVLAIVGTGEERSAATWRRCPEHERSWLAGLRDPLVSRVLGLMHAEPARHGP